MRESEFLNELNCVSRSYNWADEDLTGVAKNGRNGRGSVFNPITALARTKRLGVFKSTREGTLKAAKALGLQQSMVTALFSDNNRGHSQVLKGRVRKALRLS
jgi:hypothetical protein